MDKISCLLDLHKWNNYFCDLIGDMYYNWLPVFFMSTFVSHVGYSFFQL